MSTENRLLNPILCGGEKHRQQGYKYPQRSFGRGWREPAHPTGSCADKQVNAAGSRDLPVCLQWSSTDLCMRQLRSFSQTTQTPDAASGAGLQLRTRTAQPVTARRTAVPQPLTPQQKYSRARNYKLLPCRLNGGWGSPEPPRALMDLN